MDSYAVTLCPMSALPTPLQSAVRKNAAANPLECALTKSLDLKPPEMNTCRKCGELPPLLHLSPFSFCASPFASCASLPAAVNLIFQEKYWTAPNTAGGLAIFLSGRYDSGLAPSRYPSLCFFGCRAAGERAVSWRRWRILGRRRD